MAKKQKGDEMPELEAVGVEIEATAIPAADDDAGEDVEVEEEVEVEEGGEDLKGKGAGMTAPEVVAAALEEHGTDAAAIVKWFEDYGWDLSRGEEGVPEEFASLAEGPPSLDDLPGEASPLVELRKMVAGNLKPLVG